MFGGLRRNPQTIDSHHGRCDVGRREQTEAFVTRKLSAEQVAHFNEEGYLIVNDVFEPRELQPLREELTARIDDKINELSRAGKLQNLHTDQPFERRVTRIYRDSRDNGEAVMRHLEGKAGGGHCGIEMFRVITHPKLLAVIESLVGPEIIASSVYRIRPKVPGVGRGVVPWHQDSGYLAQHCDRTLIVTCWIPLVDANEANGCMQILPRTHRHGIVTHHRGGNAGFLVITDADLPDNPQKAITAAVPLGGVVLMTNLTPHCSTPNYSDVIRWSIDLRYQGADAPNNVGLLPSEQVEDEANAKINMACYPPEADFVVQSRRDPSRVTSYDAFVKRRAAYEDARNIMYPKRWQPLQPA
jgi:ectoine hydroxylase-related dioxygenase (phytanoyl-CoA dioxygenase family)